MLLVRLLPAFHPKVRKIYREKSVPVLNASTGVLSGHVRATAPQAVDPPVGSGPAKKSATRTRAGSGRLPRVDSELPMGSMPYFTGRPAADIGVTFAATISPAPARSSCRLLLNTQGVRPRGHPRAGMHTFMAGHSPHRSGPSMSGDSPAEGTGGCDRSALAVGRVDFPSARRLALGRQSSFG